MKKSLVFHIDQGWPNGLINTKDYQALTNVINSLSPLQARYDVVFLINPICDSWEQTVQFLEKALTINPNFRFAFDGCSSDVITLGKYGRPYDIGHGISQPVQHFEKLTERMKNAFAGIRGHETFSMSYIIAAYKAGKLPWASEFSDVLPPDEYYRLKLIEPFIALMHKIDGWYLWSDPFWSGTAKDWPGWWNGYQQDPLEQQLRDLTNAYPNTVVPCYANNEHNGTSLRRKDTYWHLCIRPVVTSKTRGWGLSNQGWLFGHKDGLLQPGEDNVYVDWALAAGGAVVRQFEPAWLLWDLAPGSPTRGKPTPLLLRLISAL